MSRQCAACWPLCIGMPWIGEFQAECGTGSHELSSAVAMSPSSGGAHAIYVEGCMERFLPRAPKIPTGCWLCDLQQPSNPCGFAHGWVLRNFGVSPTCGDQPLVGLFSSLLWDLCDYRAAVHVLSWPPLFEQERSIWGPIEPVLWSTCLASVTLQNDSATASLPSAGRLEVRVSR